MSISDKILNLAAELGPERKKLEELTARSEELTKQVGEIDDVEQEEVLLTELDEIGKEIETVTPRVEGFEKKLESYREIEKRQASMGKPADLQAPAILKTVRKKETPGDIFVKSAVVTALSHLRRMPEQQVAEELYGDDLRFKVTMPLILKTEAPIATTTDTNYASALVQEDVRGLMEEIEATSVAAALALWAQRSGGMLVNFNGAQTIRIPKLTPTGTNPTEPAWVQEGGAIPVGSLQVGSSVINRTKLAEILVTTLELKERSVVDIEDLFRRALRKAYSRVLDNALLSNAAAVPGVRPAGLMNALAGANTGTGDATGGLDSVTADLQAMTAAIMASNEAAVPVLLLNNQTRMSMSFITSALGEYVFQSEIQAGRILNVPVVSSGNVKPADTAVMVDASSLAMALDAPQFDVSQVATVVMADAGPAGTAVAPTMADDGSGGVGTAGEVQEGINVVPSAAVAAGAGAGYVARSMFQTYSEAIRMVCPTAWQLMRPGTVANRTAIKWV